jgi:N-acyl-D-aspartate/D-glutamate deacylase
MAFDLVLRGGEVFDGTGTPPRRVDIAVTGERIEAVDDLSTAESAETVEITGLSVAPGFVDVHAHTDVVMFLDDEHVDVKAAGVRQGVTTEVAGNCGSSPFPVRGDDDPYLGAFGGRRRFGGVGEYRAALAGEGLYANIAPLLGHGAVRASVVGRDARPPTDDELRDMRRVVATAMDEGAFGLSSGLIYAPGVYAQTEELIALASEMRRYGRPYTTHMRDEGDHVTDAVAEALRIAAEGGVAVQISHHKLAGRRNWGRSSETLAQIEAARAGGTDVTIDVYPYTAGSTFLAAILPPWVLDGGPRAMLERLRDSTSLDKIRLDFVAGLPGWQSLVDLAGWDSIVLAGEPPFAGRSIGDLAADEGVDETVFVARVLQENPGALIILHMMKEDEVRSIGDQPFAMVGSDGIPVPGRQHPRLAGTFARILNRHAADEQRLSDAIKRMSLLPAQRFALPDRGTIATGMFADLVVFDRRAVADKATYDDPLLYPAGIPHVLVAGRFAVRNRELQAPAGRVLEPA